MPEGIEVEDERLFRNVKYRERHAAAALVLWIFIYFAPGILLGRFASEWAGVAWMALGAAFLFAFMRKSFFPRTLAAGRDGFRLDWRGRPAFELNYEKIHEARWEDAPATLKKLFGPLVFLEPLWPMQMDGSRELVIVYAGEPLRLREDEFDGLDEFAELLQKRNVPGLAAEAAGSRPIQVYGK